MPWGSGRSHPWKLDSAGQEQGKLQGRLQALLWGRLLSMTQKCPAQLATIAQVL